MRRIAERVVFGFVLVGLNAGCIHYERRVTTEPTPARPPGDLAVRLEAARGITFLSERDQALAAIARDAARAGNAQVTEDALNSMTFLNSRDEAAGDCALSLAAAGKEAHALEVARKITSLKKRDAILKQIATGS